MASPALARLAEGSFVVLMKPQNQGETGVLGAFFEIKNTVSKLTSTVLHFSICNTLEEVEAAEWNRLSGEDSPFLSHEFLVALERHGCLGQRFGWYPFHQTVRDQRGKLVGAMPMYLKTNSYGEFVFDWSWASAYQRCGLRYYPKLVIAVPYTPVTGPRLLVHPDTKAVIRDIKQRMIEWTIAFAQSKEFSSSHWLFTNVDDIQHLKAIGLMMRTGCQYHWYNSHYEHFEHFLNGLTSRKRKKIRRERQRVKEQGIKLNVIHGHEADNKLWKLVHHFYVNTFARKTSLATLSLEFFKEIGRTLGERVVLIVAEHRSQIVACAVSFRSNNSLYGRFWGCNQPYHSLHFEACYYQGIDYCINHKLDRFEPGAQGEHKIARGFLPVRTWSAHWITHEDFRSILGDFCQREQQIIDQECRELMALSPYRIDNISPI